MLKNAFRCFSIEPFENDVVDRISAVCIVQFRWPFQVVCSIFEPRPLGKYRLAFIEQAYPREYEYHHHSHPVNLNSLDLWLQAIQLSPCRDCPVSLWFDGTFVSLFHIVLLSPFAFQLQGKMLDNFLICRK